MQKPIYPNFFLLFLVVIAVFGMALVPFLLFAPNLQIDQTHLRRPLISSAYTIICIGGIVAVLHPGKCSMMFQKPNISSKSEKTNSSVKFKGHHPECENFSTNRIAIGYSVFCAACSGLFVGAITATVGIVLFSLGFFSLNTEGLWVLAFGEILMLAGLAQIKMRGYVKMAANAIFVVGSFITLVASDLVGQSLLVDMYVLGLIVFILWFRILLSEWNNKRTCLECGHCI
jgi:hypothetical protein